MEKLKPYQNKKGFTLVEIMIVVVIIGLLAAMAIPAFQRVRAASQANACVNNLRQIMSAMDQYFMENGLAEDVALADFVGVENYIRHMPYCPAVATDSEDFKEYGKLNATYDALEAGSEGTGYSVGDVPACPHMATLDRHVLPVGLIPEAAEG